MSRRVLITGATGFVGRELGLALVRAGWTVRAVCRDPERVRGTLPFPADIRRFEDPDLLQDCAAVVHLMGEPISQGRWNDAQKQRIRVSRIDSTQALAKAIRAQPHKPAVFIQASGVGYYGDRGDTELDETQTPGQDFLADICVGWERDGLALKDAGVRAVALRIGLVLGHQGGALPVITGLYRMGLGGVLGSGRQWVSWIHIDDLIHLIMHALDTPSLSGPVNALSPNPCLYRDFHHAVEQATGCRGLAPTPEFALKLALGEKSMIVLSSQRAIPRAAEASGFSFVYPTIEAALGALYGDAREPKAARLVVKQWVPRALAEVWPFFGDEHNLERMTPPWLNFHVLGRSTPTMTAGTEIRYKLKLHGIPMSWVSRIDQWREAERFVDTQISGPYRLWYHLHQFETLAGGTLLTDDVQYKLPMGVLGNLVARPLVDRDVQKIFAYRQAVVAELFGSER